MEIKTRGLYNIIIYDIKGEIRLPKEDDITLHQHVKSQLEKGRRNFLLNFDKVDFIDSYGIGELIASFKSIHDLRGKLKLTQMHPRIRLLFKITALERIFEIFDDEETAIKNFSIENDL